MAKPVVLPVVAAAAAFGLTLDAARRFIREAGIGDDDQVEVGALAAHIARSTMGVGRAVEAA